MPIPGRQTSHNVPIGTELRAGSPPHRGNCALRTTRTRGWYALALIVTLAGCAGNKPKLEAAKKDLAVDRNQNAIEALNGVSGAEANYLRSIAMSRETLDEAAREQIGLAVTADPSHPRYKAVQLRMSVLNKEGDFEATAKELVEHCAPKLSDAGVALMAATGYGALRKPAEALKAFQTAVSLSDQIPEYWPEMLNMAMSMQDLKIAEEILGKMTSRDPTEGFVQKQRVLVLAALGKSDEAIKLASSLYEQGEYSVENAMLLAQALQGAPPGEQVEQQFADLVARHPTHVPLCILYGNYLARSGKLPLAIKTLTAVAQKLPPSERAAMLPVLIGLPLEFGDAKLAESLLLQHRAALNQPELALFYEGRIRVLQKNYKEAVRLFGIAVKRLRDSKQAQQQLLQELMLWLSKATFEANVESRLDQAIQSAEELGNTTEKTPSKTPASETPTAPSDANPAPASDGKSPSPGSTPPVKPTSSSESTTE